MTDLGCRASPWRSGVRESLSAKEQSTSRRSWKDSRSSKAERPWGALTYHVDGRECEIVTINSLEEGVGVGSALLTAVRDKAKSLGCRRLWLITTNDNLNALR